MGNDDTLKYKSMYQTKKILRWNYRENFRERHWGVKSTERNIDRGRRRVGWIWWRISSRAVCVPEAGLA